MSFLVYFMNWFSEKQQPSIHGDSVSVPIISWVQLSPTFFWECCYIREWAVTLVFSFENKIRSVRVNIFGYYLTRVSKNLKKHQPRGNVFKVLLQKKQTYSNIGTYWTQTVSTQPNNCCYASCSEPAGLVAHTVKSFNKPFKFSERKKSFSINFEPPLASLCLLMCPSRL